MDLRREAVRLRDELQTTLHVPAKIRWGGLGELTVTVDGRTIFSKRQAGRVPESGEITRTVDPKGNPVALNVRGAAVEWMLEQILKKDGLGLRDVQIKIIPFPDMVPALESGAVEAAILTEPFPTLAEERGIALRPLERPAGVKATPMTGVVWNKDWAAKNADLAHNVMVAYVKAARDLALENGWKQERNIDLMV